MSLFHTEWTEPSFQIEGILGERGSVRYKMERVVGTLCSRRFQGVLVMYDTKWRKEAVL